MKKMLAAVAVAATTLAGMAVSIPTAAEAQPYGYGRNYNYGRGYYGPARGPRWGAYRRGYYGRYNRYPRRVCRIRPNGRQVCVYR